MENATYYSAVYKYWEKIEANSPKKKFSLNEVCVKFLLFLHWIFRFLSLLHYQIDEEAALLRRYPPQQYFLQRFCHVCLNLNTSLWWPWCGKQLWKDSIIKNPLIMFLAFYTSVSGISQCQLTWTSLANQSCWLTLLLNSGYVLKRCCLADKQFTQRNFNSLKR